MATSLQALIAVILAASCNRLLAQAQRTAACEYQTLQNPGLEVILRNVIQHHDVPSMAAAVIMNNTMHSAAAVGSRVYAYRDAAAAGSSNQAANVTLCDRYHLGSDTKAFTSLLIGMAVEQGKLSWNSTLKSIFEPSVQVSSAFANITVVELLSHTSGLPSDDDTFMSLISQSFTDDGNLNDLRLHIFKNGMRVIAVNQTKPPHFAYSNFGYMILGTILEHMNKGTTWEQLITDSIFQPLNLKHAGLGCQVTLGLIDAPLPHDKVNGTVRRYLAGPNCDNPLVTSPAGAAHMSILDFAEWGRFQLSRGATVSPPLVKPATIDYLHTEVVKVQIPDPQPGTPPSGAYAKGWGVVQTTWSDHPVLFHAGSNNMNLAFIYLDMKAQYGMVLTTNMGGREAEAALFNATAQIAKLSR